MVYSKEFMLWYVNLKFSESSKYNLMGNLIKNCQILVGIAQTCYHIY